MDEQRLTKVVIPVAGMGTRMLPATRAVPKEILPIVDRPLIQYIIDECVASGFREIIFITQSSKRAIEDYFDVQRDLDTGLERNGTTLTDQLSGVDDDTVFIASVRQGAPRGLGHAILCARPLIGDSPFAVVLPDVLLDESRNRPKVTGLALLKRRAELSGNSQLMVHHVPASEVNKYGIVDLGPEPFAQRQIERLRAVVEKPAPDEAPSCFAVTGRYIFTPGIWPLLEAVTADKKGEIQLTNAIQQLLTKETVECLCKQGNLYDCGDKLGYMKATLAMALQHPDIGESFRAYAEETLNLKSLNLPVLKSGDSSSDTAMPGRENISGRGDVTVMLRSAI